MNQQYFEAVCNEMLHMGLGNKGIGTLSEKTTHAVIKKYLEPEEDCHEIKVAGFVADICTKENDIIEIQTRSFEKLRRKLEAFLDDHIVTVVYPIPSTKYLCWIDRETGEISKKRKSPKKGNIYQIIPELYKIKYLLPDDNFRLKILMIDMEEYKYLDGWSKDKKRGATKCDRIPTKLIEEICINSVLDYQIFLPKGLPITFTTKDFAKAGKINARLAQIAVHILHYIGEIERVGKKGNLFLYEKRVSEEKAE